MVRELDHYWVFQILADSRIFAMEILFVKVLCVVIIVVGVGDDLPIEEAEASKAIFPRCLVSKEAGE